MLRVLALALVGAGLGVVNGIVWKPIPNDPAYDRVGVLEFCARDADASLFAIGYAHLLSKRTTLYANVGRLTNAKSAAFRMGPAMGEQVAAGLPVAGQDTTGTQFGIRHWF